MIDLNKLRAPGWQRIVAELNAPAPDDRVFLMRLLAVVAQASAAKQAVLWAVPPADADDAQAAAAPRALLVWPNANPEQPPGPPEEGQIDFEIDARIVARGGAVHNRIEVQGLETDQLLYDGQNKGYLVGAPLGGSGAETVGGSRQVISLLLDGRSKQALQTTLAIIELLCGYVQGHAARQALKRTRAASAALDLATGLIAAINTSPNFKGATLQLCNDLSRTLGAERVAIGWTKGIGHKGEGDAVRVVAISDTENLDRRMTLVQSLEKAMDECLDQDQPVMFPPPPERSDASGQEGDLLLAQAITHSHRELVASDAKAKVVSIPLRVDEDTRGVLTVEITGDGTIEPGQVELLQSACDLIAPVLRLRRSDDRNVAFRAYDDSLKAAGWLVGAKHTVWKLAGVAVVAVVLFVLLFRAEYRVSAPVTIEPVQKRYVSAPFDGIVASVEEGIEEGTVVEAGQVLAHLDSTEIELQRLDAVARRAEAETQIEKALAERDTAAFKQAEQRVVQAQAEVDLYQTLIEKAAITAPISGSIITGDLSDRVGSSVALGDGLFEIAPLDTMIVIARVEDRDISLVQAGMTGDVATKARPGDRFAMTVTRIVPLATPEEGKNAFEVRAELADPPAWMRPGMEGLAKFDTGERTLADIGTRRIRDTLRFWLWW